MVRTSIRLVDSFETPTQPCLQVPYFGYARADRKSQGRESIAAKLVANMITEAGVLDRLQ